MEDAARFQVSGVTLLLEVSVDGDPVAGIYTLRADGYLECEGGGPLPWVRAELSRDFYAGVPVEELSGEEATAFRAELDAQFSAGKAAYEARLDALVGEG